MTVVAMNVPKARMESSNRDICRAFRPVGGGLGGVFLLRRPGRVNCLRTIVGCGFEGLFVSANSCDV